MGFVPSAAVGMSPIEKGHQFIRRDLTILSCQSHAEEFIDLSTNYLLQMVRLDARKSWDRVLKPKFTKAKTPLVRKTKANSC